MSNIISKVQSELDEIREKVERPLFWIVDGQAYDFTPWMNKHPGGAMWFSMTQGRDISLIFHTYHRDPRRLQKMLEPFKITNFTEKDVLPNMGIPEFMLAEGLDASRDLPKFDFTEKKTLLDSIREKVNEKTSRAQFKRWDQLFDAMTVVLILIHIGIMAALVTGNLPIWAFIILMMISRTALSSPGHYYTHRGKPTLGDALLDINYVGTFLTGTDGHVLIHHPYLGTGADAKVQFFGGMLRLPPLLRVPGYTLHKFFAFILGIQLAGALLMVMMRKIPIKGKRQMFTTFWLMRIWLLLEFAVCIATGYWLAWVGQFIASLWFNTFMTVASHDFNETADNIQKLPEHLRDDWAAQQIVHSDDLTIVGNRWIDSYLSAGLSPHRVHHVLPLQGSAFANIVAEDAVREACEEAGIKWNKPCNLFLQRLPAIAKEYVLNPLLKRRDKDGVLPFGMSSFCRYVFDGFKGGVF